MVVGIATSVAGISRRVTHPCRSYTVQIIDTNRCVGEHDDAFEKYLEKIRAICINMETATIFMTEFCNEISTGALLLVSDQPMTPAGGRTAASNRQIDVKFVNSHLRIGIDSLR